jgi:hypothetical protein
MKNALNNLILDKNGNLDVDQLIDLLESFETFAKLNSSAVNSDLINLSKKEIS